MVGYTADPNTLDPWKATQFQAVHLLEQVYGTLTQLDANLAVHELDQLFADGQSQTGPAVFAGGGAIRLSEGLEQERNRVGGNSDAGVSDGETENELLF